MWRLLWWRGDAAVVALDDLGGANRAPYQRDAPIPSMLPRLVARLVLVNATAPVHTSRSPVGGTCEAVCETFGGHLWLLWWLGNDAAVAYGRGLH